LTKNIKNIYDFLYVSKDKWRTFNAEIHGAKYSISVASTRFLGVVNWVESKGLVDLISNFCILHGYCYARSNYKLRLANHIWTLLMTYQYFMRNDPYTHFSQQSHNKLTWLIIFYYFFCFVLFSFCKKVIKYYQPRQLVMRLLWEMSVGIIFHIS
jgi:hypothetical protein